MSTKEGPVFTFSLPPCSLSVTPLTCRAMTCEFLGVTFALKSLPAPEVSQACRNRHLTSN